MGCVVTATHYSCTSRDALRLQGRCSSGICGMAFGAHGFGGKDHLVDWLWKSRRNVAVRGCQRAGCPDLDLLKVSVENIAGAVSCRKDI